MRVSKFGLCLAFLAALPPSGFGQCRTVQVVQTVNGQPVVTRSVQCGNTLPVPVVQQSYQTAAVQPTYAAQTYAAPTYEHRVVAVPVQVQPDYVFSVRDELRDKLLVDAIAGRLAPLLIQQQQNNALLQQQLNLMSQRQQQAVQQPQIPAAVDPVKPLPILPLTQAPAKKAATGEPTDGGGLGYQGKPELVRLFAERCNRCHGDNGVVKGGVDLRDLTKLTDADWSDIYQDCDLATMPKDDKPLNPEEYKIVQTAVREARKLAKR